MYKTYEGIKDNKKATIFQFEDGTTECIINTPTNHLGEVGKQSTDNDFNQGEFNMWMDYYKKEKFKEREISILVLKLHELGVECYHKDGIPMIQTMRKGKITREDLQGDNILAVSEGLLYLKDEELNKINIFKTGLQKYKEEQEEERKKYLLRQFELEEADAIRKRDLKDMTLEERQAEWDKEHTGINAELNMEQYKYGRPARPTERLDDLQEKSQQPTKSFSDLIKEQKPEG